MKERNPIVDILLFKSYCAQRDSWLDLETCSPQILQVLDEIYPDRADYETIYGE